MLACAPILEPVVENGEVAAVRFKVMLKKGNRQQVHVHIHVDVRQQGMTTFMCSLLHR